MPVQLWSTTGEESLRGIPLLYGGLAAIFGYYLYTIIYSAYFHPLAGFPGPKFRAVSRLPMAASLAQGKFAHDAKALHQKYGSIVRLAPNQLSFTNPAAWKDIYGHMNNRPSFQKDRTNYFVPINGVDSIHSACDDAVHARHRRLLAHAFSEKALRDQESLMRSYIDLLIDKLHKEVQGPKDGKVDIVRWLNYTTFDLIGDLTFGEPFGCLDNSEYHPWVSIIFESMRAATIIVGTRQFPSFAALIGRLIPSAVTQKMRDHFNLSKERMDRRLAMKTDRPDFVTCMLAQKGERSLAPEELHSNSPILIIGGSETTATALSACLYFLNKYPEVYQKLAAEVRTRFTSKDELIVKNLVELKYMTAVIEETMRIYPPVPGYLPRVAPKEGAHVAGEWIPGGTQVTIVGLAMAHSPSNYKDPESFVPERWLEGDQIYASDQKAAHMPFSYGPRNCIGKNLAWAEMRLLLARLLWEFDIGICEESKNWEVQKTYMLWEKPPLIVKLTPRSGA
ncbi:benzoate 4-monooxygenase cytochrome P450 [Lepidopterella palustris CBS 459.81]|uniref:Benzoate 4-monooxygenase cytochrome P450 n=1 Tax=Lepidopterella palustris CBS 459.81 TaxID=1314670 RepID=A0A8E2J9M1_9PEZI|nr:benzoate 4-monooxygenase cytochrome P450 [Lepidopterella palustris CBS 459.81]